MNPFEELLKRVRAGDNEAAAEIFNQYSADVKRVVRGLMRIESVRRKADPSDIFQSVMASFFIRAALGQYEIASRDQLKALLIRMARNKVADLARSPDRMTSLLSVAEQGAPRFDRADSAKDPASVVQWRDLLQRFRERLTDEERKVSDLRMLGHRWDDVGAALGERGQTVRVRLERAIQRIGGELKIMELSE